MHGQAETVNARKPWPSLTENSALRFVAIFLLYFSQGIPIGICIIAVPAWLTAQGATPADVGLYVSVVVLPWGFKLINGLLMDRWTYLAMGRRRAWLLGSQLVLICNLIAMIALQPGSEDLTVLMILGFCMNVATSFQDVAVDGMAVDIVPKDERGKANGVMFAGQKFGIALTSAVGGWALVHGGPALAAAIVATVVLLIFILMAIVRERPGEKLMPWSSGRSSCESQALQQGRWLPILKGVFEAFLKPTTALFAIGAAFYGIARGVMEPTAPTFAVSQLGWASAQYSAYYGTLNIAIALISLVVVGPVSDRFGIGRTIFFILFMLMALQTLFGLSGDLWDTSYVFNAYLFLYLMGDLAMLIVMCAWIMYLCNPAVSASQFAMFLAIPNLAKAFSASQLGNIMDWGGYQAVFLFSSLFFGIALVLMILARVGQPAAAFQQPDDDRAMAA